MYGSNKVDIAVNEAHLSGAVAGSDDGDEPNEDAHE
jgi:hypothetical protein